MILPVGKYRWVIVTLLFFATTINYLDRQVIGLLKDALATELRWSEQDYSAIVMAFTAAYAIGQFLFGRIVDSVGTKWGYKISIVTWSFAAVGHGFVSSTFGFSIMRTVLGLGEGGNFPTAIKAIAEWFPKKERAFAAGILNSGTNIAAVLGPFVVMWIYSHYGWREAFIWTGIIGFVWLILWQRYYSVPQNQMRLSASELDYINSDLGESKGDGRKSKLVELFTKKGTWIFSTGKFFTDPIWYFYLFWIPSYFNSAYHIDLKSSWIYVSTIYFVAGFGSIIGGFFSGWLIRRGWTAIGARKRVMFIYALCALPIVLVRFTSDVWTAVALISLAAAAHQAWSANIFTTASDYFPKKDVSSVVGVGGMAGAVSGIAFPFVIGIVLDHFRLLGNISVGYNIIFLVCGCAYLFAWTLMHAISRTGAEQKSKTN
jgi:ACS family hexuronate transporter-like MFS transporter